VTYKGATTGGINTKARLGLYKLGVRATQTPTRGRIRVVHSGERGVHLNIVQENSGRDAEKHASGGNE